MCVFRDSRRSLGWHCSAAPTLIGCWPLSLAWMGSHLGTFHSHRIVGRCCRRNCIPVSIQWPVWVGRGKSITVIIMTMEANSTATGAILKPSAASAYQGAPWDQQEDALAPRPWWRFTHRVHTHMQIHTNTTRTHSLWREASTGMNQHISKNKFITQHISLDAQYPQKII